MLLNQGISMKRISDQVYTQPLILFVWYPRTATSTNAVNFFSISDGAESPSEAPAFSEAEEVPLKLNEFTTHKNDIYD